MKLNQRKATIVYVNNRKENHGEEKKLACDVSVKIKGPPELLDEFDPTLRPDFFYTEQGKDHIPKHPEITSMVWEKEFEDAEITIGDMTFKPAKLNEFVVGCGEGGVVTISFKAHFLINTEDLGPLADFMKEDTDLQFTTQFDLVDQAEQQRAA